MARKRPLLLGSQQLMGLGKPARPAIRKHHLHLIQTELWHGWLAVVPQQLTRMPCTTSSECSSDK